MATHETPALDVLTVMLVDEVDATGQPELARAKNDAPSAQAPAAFPARPALPGRVPGHRIITAGGGPP